VDEHDAELLSAPRLLDELPLKGAVVTGDALYCQRALCQQIVAAGGDYVVIVKGNQPRLQLRDSAKLGRSPVASSVLSSPPSSRASIRSLIFLKPSDRRLLQRQDTSRLRSYGEFRLSSTRLVFGTKHGTQAHDRREVVREHAA
jgi:hypothetical protein